ncbi:MAG: hypothetical protein HOE44_16975 [Candidatus Marinimicrobia bacterium]|jgi:hypothetical protein|nr:hypothetical protein [Candidatus Neomarinimicrobiota bacterium]
MHKLSPVAEIKQNADFERVDKLFYSAVSLRPQLIMGLLETYKTVKAKRLFLWFADRHRFAWFEHLEAVE